MDDGGEIYTRTYIVHEAKGKPKSVNTCRSTGVDMNEQEIRIES